jgi:hypothetical protein
VSRDGVNGKLICEKSEGNRLESEDASLPKLRGVSSHGSSLMPAAHTHIYTHTHTPMSTTERVSN